MKGGVYTMSMSIEEAKALMTPESIDNLRNHTTTKPVINTSNKVNNDILMQALCRAVMDGVIHYTSLDDRLIKLLNSETNTLSQNKLGSILSSLRKHQSNLVCCISLMSADMSTVVKSWNFVGPDVRFNGMFDYILNKFEITPTMIRTKMVSTLKPTIVNNIGQLVSKYLSMETDDARNSIVVSISTINRLVNMCDHLLFAEFKEL